MSGPRWEILEEALPLAAIRYGRQRARMLVIGLRPGELLVVSPGTLDAERLEQVRRWGKPRFLLAPNHFHNMGLRSWTALFPDARVVAHPRALPRLRRRLPAIRFEALDALLPELPPHVRVFGPPMAKQGETWISLRTDRGTVWWVTDAILNEERLRGAFGLALRLLGMRTGLVLNPWFQRFFLEDRAAFRGWLASELARDPPAVLVPAHGGIVREDAAARIAGLISGS